MKAKKICNRLNKAIEEKKNIYGFIHSVHKRAFNIMTSEFKLISVMNCEHSMAPCSLMLDREENFVSLGIEQGMRVIIFEELIDIPQVSLAIDLMEAQPWDPTPKFVVDKAKRSEIAERIAIVEKCIYEFGRFEGIAPLVLRVNIRKSGEGFVHSQANYNKYCKFIEKKFLRLIDHLQEDRLKEAAKIAKKIMGFGPGLTPSVDDVLVGIMLSLIYFLHYIGEDRLEAKLLSEEVLKAVKNETTAVSFKMLTFASKGETNEDIRQLLIDIFSNNRKEKLIKSLKKVLTFGASSGTDIICGIYLGCSIMINKYEVKSDVCSS
ncbi:MAG: hypothetical protein COA82_06820 [Alkaliphilus sp.]|nr:DUF2877 domain-containing protein [bacterium AH-315-L21]PHS34796.1 MAG: hypothetical protein COA82_06820 [Alkaliphilus sp.]